MDELIGVGLEALALFAAIFTLGRAAEFAAAVLPSVRGVFEADVALGVVKAGDRVYAVGVLGTIETATGEQAGQLGDGDAVELVVEDVVHPFLQVGETLFQPDQQPLGDFPQKHPALARRVQELRVRVAEQLLRQHVQHGVRHLRRGEYLVVGEVRNAGEDVGVVDGVVEVFRLTHRGTLLDV